jgi:hypothetical protein
LEAGQVTTAEADRRSFSISYLDAAQGQQMLKIVRNCKHSGRSPIRVKQWNRSDKIATIAAVISVLSVVITGFATEIDYVANRRAHQSDLKGAEAVVVSIGEKVIMLGNDAETIAGFFDAFNDGISRYPNSVGEVRKLQSEFLRKLALPAVSLSTDQLILLAHTDGDSSAKLMLCASRRDEVQSDIKGIGDMDPDHWTIEQINILNVLPYRLRKLSNACKQAVQAFAAITPRFNPDDVLPGTIGEIEDAEAERLSRLKAGLTAALTLGDTKPKRGHLQQENTKPTN